MLYLLSYVLFVTAFTPWLVVYLTVSVAAFRGPLLRPSRIKESSLANTVSLTINGIWIVNAPLLMIMAGMFLGLYGSLGVTIYGAAIGIDQRFARRGNWSFGLRLSLLTFGFIALLAGLSLTVPHSVVAEFLPRELRRWSGADS